MNRRRTYSLNSNRWEIKISFKFYKIDRKQGRKVIFCMYKVSYPCRLLPSEFYIQYNGPKNWSEGQTDMSRSTFLMILVQKIYNLWDLRCLLRCAENSWRKLIYPLQGYKNEFGIQSETIKYEPNQSFFEENWEELR